MYKQRSIVAGTLAVGMTVGGALVASPASAAAPAARIVDAYVSNDAGTPGVMDAGDTFALVFDRAIRVNGPSLGISFINGDGARGFYGDQYPDIRWSVEDLVTTGRNGRTKVSADRVLRAEVLADEFTILQSLPLSITDVTGIYPLNAEREVDLVRSTDKVIDLE